MKGMANIRKWVLAFAIAIVLNLFINYGISVFYKAPLYDDFCRQQGGPYAPYAQPAYPLKQTDCATVEVSDALQKSCMADKGYVAYKYNSTGWPTEAYCETCQAKFNDINNRRSSNIFVILVVFGVVAIIAGIAVKAEAVANGLLIGGIISLIVAAIRNWGQLSDILRFIVLGIVLVLLIWVGYKKGISGIGEGQQTPAKLQSAAGLFKRLGVCAVL